MDHVTGSLENLEEIHISSVKTATKVFVNGDWIGIHREPDHVTQLLKEYRRDGNLGMPEVSIVRDVRERELRIYSEGGRVCRPLFIVQEGRITCNQGHIMKMKSLGPDRLQWKQMAIEVRNSNPYSSLGTNVTSSLFTQLPRGTSSILECSKS